MRDFSKEIKITTARSGGSGGQNVNKVETMAIAHWPIGRTSFFTPEEQATIRQKLSSSISKEGMLIVKSNRARTQLENRALVIHKALLMVNEAIVPLKNRKATKVPAFVLRKRKEQKMHLAEKKRLRRQNLL